MYKCKHYTHTHAQTPQYSHTHTHTHTFTYTHIHAAHMHTHTHMHVHTHAHVCTHTHTHAQLSLPLVLPFLIMLTHAEFQTFLFTLEIAVGSEDTCKELWSKAQNTTIYSLPFDWDLKFKSILKSYYKRVLNSTVVIVFCLMFVKEKILQPLRMWSLFIKSEKLEEILCHSLPLRMLAEDSWDLWIVLGNILFLYIMTGWEGRRKVRPCISHADVIDRDENPAIYKNLCKVYVSSFLAIISTLNTVHTETLLEHSLSYSWLYFRPIAFSIGIIHALRPAGDSFLSAQLSLMHIAPFHCFLR